MVSTILSESRESQRSLRGGSRNEISSCEKDLSIAPFYTNGWLLLSTHLYDGISKIMDISEKLL